jgi:gas vesicle protein
MQELINKLMSEVGLTSEQASKALHTVVSHVKGILPPAFGASIDGLLEGKSPIAAGATPYEQASMADKASNLAGDAKDKLTEVAGDAKEKLTEMADQAKEKFAALTSDEGIESMKNKAEDLKDKAEDMAEDAINKLKGLFGGKKD